MSGSSSWPTSLWAVGGFWELCSSHCRSVRTAPAAGGPQGGAASASSHTHPPCLQQGRRPAAGAAGGGGAPRPRGRLVPPPLALDRGARPAGGARRERCARAPRQCLPPLCVCCSSPFFTCPRPPVPCPPSPHALPLAHAVRSLDKLSCISFVGDGAVALMMASGLGLAGGWGSLLSGCLAVWQSGLRPLVSPSTNAGTAPPLLRIPQSWRCAPGRPTPSAGCPRARRRARPRAARFCWRSSLRCRSSWGLPLLRITSMGL